MFIQNNEKKEKHLEFSHPLPLKLTKTFYKFDKERSCSKNNIEFLKVNKLKLVLSKLLFCVSLFFFMMMMITTIIMNTEYTYYYYFIFQI